ncbi:MAG: trypsin-like peptidase domain-containing protein, partial [Saprospiraceae bacterium]|nr:trypsin-like peptidase domain-containing protein [Saprospiraceae bacterium]
MNKRPLLLSLALSFVVAVVTAITVVFIYDQYRIKDIETSYQSDARFVVENEVLVSENFKRLFTSSSPTDFTDAALLGVKSVVYVRSIKNGPLQSIQTGSGVILTSDGYIITNYHVIADAERIEITLDDKRTLAGKVLGTDEFTDLAVLKIEAENLPYVMMYDSDSLRVG